MFKPHPWFEPLYRRVLTTAFCVSWLIFELFQGDSFWLILVAAATGFALWDFFLSGNYGKGGADAGSDAS
jgi:hypothetical protein